MRRLFAVDFVSTDLVTWRLWRGENGRMARALAHTQKRVGLEQIRTHYTRIDSRTVERTLSFHWHTQLVRLPSLPVPTFALFQCPLFACGRADRTSALARTRRLAENAESKTESTLRPSGCASFIRYWTNVVNEAFEMAAAQRVGRAH